MATEILRVWPRSVGGDVEVYTEDAGVETGEYLMMYKPDWEPKDGLPSLSWAVPLVDAYGDARQRGTIGSAVVDDQIDKMDTNSALNIWIVDNRNRDDVRVHLEPLSEIHIREEGAVVILKER